MKTLEVAIDHIHAVHCIVNLLSISIRSNGTKLHPLKASNPLGYLSTRYLMSSMNLRVSAASH